MGVDEGVGIRLCSRLERFSLVVVIVGLLNNRSRDLNRSSADSRCSLNRCCRFSSEWSRRLSIGSCGDVGALKDSESILASSVSHSDGLASLINVAVLSNSLSISSGLLPIDCPILLSKSCSKSTISSIEPLLFQNLSLLRLNKLGAGCSSKAGDNNKFQHDECGACTLPLF